MAFKLPACRRKVFTTGEVSKMLGISQQTVTRCFDAGAISGFKVPGSRFRRITREGLIAFVKAHHGMPMPEELTDQAAGEPAAA